MARNIKQQLLEELAKTPVVQIACQKLSIGRTTYYRLRKEDTTFARLADEALDEGRKVINDLGETTVISKMKNEQDIQAARFWLTHNDPRYGNKLEIKGSFTNSFELTPEQEALLLQAAKMALPQQSYVQPKPEEKEEENEDDKEYPASAIVQR